MRLDDPELVRVEYASEERLVRRRLDRWALYLGEDPEEEAAYAVLETAPLRVLDAGCGTGAFAARLRARLGCAVVAIDQSEHMVELARSRGVEASVADVQSLPFGDGEFDCAVANWMLYHLPDLDLGLQQLARVLRPGGRLVAITNGEQHLEEVWGVHRGGAFSNENGAAALSRHFGHVERRDVPASAIFATREALRGYADAFSGLGWVPICGIEEMQLPLRVTPRSAVFLADKVGG